MKIIRHKQIHSSDKQVVKVENLQIQYEERDIDLERIRKIALRSSKRIQKEHDDRLKKAIKNHDSFYIQRELDNVSTYELIKMLINKIFSVL